MRMFSKLPQLLMLMLVVLPMVMVSDRAMARAEEDEGVVEEEGGEAGEEAGGETAEDEGLKTTSPDAETVILFTKPPGTSNMGRRRPQASLARTNILLFSRTPSWPNHRVPGRVYQQGRPGDDRGQHGGLPQVPHGLHLPPPELLCHQLREEREGQTTSHSCLLLHCC